MRFSPATVTGFGPSPAPHSGKPAPPPYMAEALPVVRERLRVEPTEAPWWNWLIVDRASGEAVGSVAFGGRSPRRVRCW